METKEIKTGDILLVSSKSWLARQIQKFQRRISPNGYNLITPPFSGGATTS